MHYRNERNARALANAYQTEDVPEWKLFRMIELLAQARTIDERLVAIEYLLKHTMTTERESV